jgi:hypothetical protein
MSPRAAELKSLVGEAAWRELVAWLERVLERCWSDHGGRRVERGDASFTVEFDQVAKAEACIRTVRAALQEHRTSHGFAPELDVAVNPVVLARPEA